LFGCTLVIGRSFEPKVLVRLAQKESEENVLEYLEQALAEGLIEAETVEGYRFSHVLIQEVLSEDVSAARKARRHARIANAIETLYGMDLGPRTGEVLRLGLRQICNHSAKLAYLDCRLE
jgi:predicted ATPase